MTEEQYAGMDYDNGPGLGRNNQDPRLVDDAVPPLAPGEVWARSL